jgi:hypothetical protein
MDLQTKNTTAGAWRERISAQQASGQQIRAWCRENGCHEHALYWWRAKLGLSPVTSKPRRRAVGGKRVDFTRLVLEPSAQREAALGSEPIRLSLIGGRMLTFPVSMPVGQIASLVRAIEGACPEPVEGAA